MEGTDQATTHVRYNNGRLGEKGCSKKPAAIGFGREGRRREDQQATEQSTGEQPEEVDVYSERERSVSRSCQTSGKCLYYSLNA